MLDKNLSNDKGLEVNVAISQKTFELQNFWQGYDMQWNERKPWELTVWIR